MKTLLGLLVLAAAGWAQTPLPSPINGGSGGGGGTGCVPSGTANRVVVSDGAGGCNITTIPVSGSTITASLTGAASLNLLTSNNLSDLASAATARTNLGLTGGTCASNQFANAVSAVGVPTCAAPFTLTTTGTSGAATFSAGTLNIPQYTGGGGGATIPSTTNVIKGDGAGNGADTKVAITSPTTAATLSFPTDNATITFQGTDTYVGRVTTDTLTNKTLTTPTIGSFTNATHGHTNAAGGGQLNITTASNATGTPSSTTFLRGDNSWAAPGGTGTVTVVGAGSLTSTALVTGGGSQTVQTPSATATLDSSGNISTPGSLSTGVGGSVGGYTAFGQGTATTAPTSSVGFMAPTSVTTKFMMTLPAAPATGFMLNTGTTDPSTVSFVASSGSGNVCLTTNCAMTTPNLGTPSALDLTNATKIPLTLTTTGTSGAATYTQSTNTLNVPQYTGSGGTSGGTVVSKTVDYSAVSGDSGTVIYFNGTNKTYTLLSTVPTMPWIVGVCNINSTALTIARGTATINGGTSNLSLGQYDCTTIESDTATGGNNYVANTPLVAGTGISLTPAANGRTVAASAVPSASLNITTTTCTAPTFVSSISSGAVGTCTAPVMTQNSQSAAYTTVLGDAGKMIYHPGADTTARTWTIDSNANVAYAVGTCITFVNDTSAGVVTIAITSDTMVLAGAGTTGSRTLAASNVATACKVTTTRWIISGSSGLT